MCETRFCHESVFHFMFLSDLKISLAKHHKKLPLIEVHIPQNSKDSWNELHFLGTRNGNAAIISYGV